MKLKKNIAISKSGFVFDPTSGDSFSLNPIGKEILEMLQENESLEKITEIIEKKYDVEKNDLEKYLVDFLSMLKQFNLTEEEEK